MNKRIFSFVLSLIMLVSLVPVTALQASAAGMSISEGAITVLKQLEGYSMDCATGTDGKNYYTGYGTLCTKPVDRVTNDHSGHETSETEADEALRAELKVLDKAVNSFASKHGLSLNQGQHNALVLFSFQNGTSWTDGSGAFQNAIKSGATGSEFLSAICMWSHADDDNRRKIEAHMYLTGLNNSTVQASRYRTITFNPNGGKLNNHADAIKLYFDTGVDKTLNLVPVKSGYDFMGWYNASNGKLVTSLTGIGNGGTLNAQWQQSGKKPGETTVSYTTTASERVTLYKWEEKTDEDTKEKYIEFEETEIQVKGDLTIDSEYIDANGVRWARVSAPDNWYEGDNRHFTASFSGKVNAKAAWIRLGDVSFGSGSITGSNIDVTVTVTNDYVRVRAENNIYSKQLRKANLGEQLHIVNTASSKYDSFLWGEIAGGKGWVALMYTNFEEVRNTGKPVNNVVGVATVVLPVDGFVNVRSGAGTDNRIVGALPYKSRVNIYEIEYVNGIKWGRYDGGWFCLSYADLDGVNVDDYVGNSTVLAYAFNGKIKGTPQIYTSYKNGELVDQDQLIEDEKLDAKDKLIAGSSVTVSNLTEYGGYTWGKISLGWVKVTDNATYKAENVDLNVAKYYTIVDGVTVRKDKPEVDSERVNNLVKGVEFNVNNASNGERQVVAIGDTIWGYADKVGEGAKTYSGWINLASKYVARGDAPTSIPTNKIDAPTGEIATIVGADRVNVRIHHDIYAKILGKISRGTKVAVLGYEDGWYKLDYDVDSNTETDSWVSKKYVEISKAAANNGTTTGTNGSGVVETGLGIVANTYGGVNVRTGAGTGYAATGKLLPGTTVEILEVTAKGNSKWGRTAQGWVCMDYITMVTNYEILAGVAGGNNSGNNSTVTGSESAIYTGTTKGSQPVYKTTSTDSDVIRTVVDGGSITLHEILSVTKETYLKDDKDETHITRKTEYWARVNDGYILDPAASLSLDTLNEQVYTVTGSDKLNVRELAGTSNKLEYRLNKGDQVVITKLTIIDGNVWGFVEAANEKVILKDEDGNPVVDTEWDGDGWISLAYCTKGVIDLTPPPAETVPPVTTPPLGVGSDNGGFVNNATGYRYTGKVINTNKVNVRAFASQTAAKTTELAQGSSLVIYETTTSEGMAWGRCDAGWVYLYYVDLTPVVNGAVDARVVYNDNTIAYTDMNRSEVAGTYAKMAVIDIYEIVGKMARTDMGWVDTDNLL